MAAIVALCSSLALGEAAPAQLPAPLGGDFQINSHTLNRQANPAVAVDADGDFVVVWQSERDPGYGVFARRFSSAGAPLANELQVNTYTTGNQKNSLVAPGVSGGFIVTWESIGQDGDSEGIFARRFNSAGVGLGIELQVNTYTLGQQLTPEVAEDAGGGFVVVWAGAGTGDDFGIFARRFDSGGTPQAAEFRVNATTAGFQLTPSVDRAVDGDFVVAWRGSDISGHGVLAQRFSSAGASVGPEFQVPTYLTGDQVAPSVGVDADGNFVVAWMSDIQDAGTDGIFARRFDSAGTPTGLELQVNTYVTGSQSYPRVAVDLDGDFVIVWISPQDGNGSGIIARRYKSPGVPTTGEIQVNSYITGNQVQPAVAADAEGDFVVAWTNPGGQDGSLYGTFGRRFDVPVLIDVDGDGQFLPLTDGLLLVRSGFGFTGAALVTGAVGQGCTRCDGAAVAVYLETLQ